MGSAASSCACDSHPRPSEVDIKLVCSLFTQVYIVLWCEYCTIYQYYIGYFLAVVSCLNDINSYNILVVVCGVVMVGVGNGPLHLCY